MNQSEFTNRPPDAPISTFLPDRVAFETVNPIWESLRPAQHTTYRQACEFIASSGILTKPDGSSPTDQVRPQRRFGSIRQPENCTSLRLGVMPPAISSTSPASAFCVPFAIDSVDFAWLRQGADLWYFRTPAKRAVCAPRCVLSWRVGFSALAAKGYGSGVFGFRFGHVKAVRRVSRPFVTAFAKGGLEGGFRQ